ncbi:MFS general substrate transporter [Sistotremastrum suecicum HHB10207 ss-3]|uniref:MFS general substrate transporter n=1 Tax=Sistotremastrum suecicum HHB10207 ss-3 TaxID=1314776 RepID=A0A166H6D5_9AGAM|nr:MFS general substrate transporter [Sistotremastrum suecicum HHB10207 ss-3]
MSDSQSSNGSLEKKRDPERSVHEPDAAVARNALLKIDLVVLPIVTMFYFLSFLDRSNIGNAKVAGLLKDLKMTPTQYSIALTVTYVPYIVFELPSNLVLKRFGANVTLPLMVTLWGVVTACQGAVTSYHGLLACRFFLGAVEGGLLPGLILYLSSFYKRHQLQLRVALMFTATSLAGAFSGLLAAAISHMAGDRGKPGWAWIFILEGVFTTVFGIFAYFVMPRTVEETPFLTTAEREAVIATKEEWVAEEEAETFSWSEVFSAFKEPHLWLLSPALFFNGTTLYGLAFFAPSIVSALGQSANRSQLLTVPPYACAFVVSLIFAYLSDKYRQRGLVLITVSMIAIAGYGLFLGSAGKHNDYGALFLQVVGAYTSAPTVSAWQANNFQPHYKRATAIAWAFILTNSGGILSTWIFNDPPRYAKATKINLAFSVGIAACALGNMLYLRSQNIAKKKWLAENDEASVEGDAKKLGNRHPNFQYTL